MPDKTNFEQFSVVFVCFWMAENDSIKIYSQTDSECVCLCEIKRKIESLISANHSQ